MAKFGSRPSSESDANAVAGAEAVGMTAILHRSPTQTISELERLFEIDLST